ncbi:MAG: terminase small subunit, partial [Stutzerimonas stutzeri]
MTVMKKSEFADSQGWSRPYVSKLASQGRLVMTEDGK